ncbi:class I SAM-dependent methyltransferase [Paeniglutamicibacter antarcticus]|uniref:Class I SAM-dependent methyltransferase n=1 Tax=Paeniglutamicibacter antarcticus TaxID=494023 RepID=A0ABP9TLY6_9MICC
MTQDTNYDSFAEAYSAENETSLINGYYERPAMIKLAGDVRSRQILDAGCGSGPLAKALCDLGATVTGFDSSKAMIDLARKRLGEGAQLLVADLGQPLPFADDSFDDVVASLVFHYLEDWLGSLNEIRRVLRPGGRLIMSVNHPILYPWTNPGADYFKPTKYSDDHTFNGQLATLTYWHRPLQAMTEAFTKAGFQIEVVSEPPFSADAPAEIIPPQFEGRKSFLSFIFFVLRAQ